MSFIHSLEHAGSSLIHSGEHALGIDSGLSSARHHLHDWKHDAKKALKQAEDEVKRARAEAAHLKTQWALAERALSEARREFQKEIHHELSEIEQLTAGIKKIKGLVSGISKSMQGLMQIEKQVGELSPEASQAVSRIVTTVSGEFSRLKDQLNTVTHRLSASSLMGEDGEAEISYALQELETLQHYASRMLEDLDVFLMKEMPEAANKIMAVFEQFFMPSSLIESQNNHKANGESTPAATSYQSAFQSTVTSTFDLSKKIYQIAYERHQSGLAPQLKDSANGQPSSSEIESEIKIMEKTIQDHLNQLMPLLDAAPSMLFTIMNRLIPISQLNGIQQRLTSIHEQMAASHQPQQPNHPGPLAATAMAATTKRHNEENDDDKDKDKDDGGPIAKGWIWGILSVITALRILTLICDNIGKVTPIGMSVKFKFDLLAKIKAAVGWAGGADAEGSAEEEPGVSQSVSCKYLNLLTLVTSLTSGIMLLITKLLELSVLYMKTWGAIEE